MGKEPELIYHYTNFVALEGILFGEGIRLCCSKEMNDSQEVEHFIKILEKAVLNRCEKKGGQESLIAERIFCEQREKRKNDVTYLVSFSEWEDDAAQWERYGNCGYGVAIGFNLKELKKALQNCFVMCKRVFYDRNAENHELIDDILDAINGKFPTHHGFDTMDGIFDNVWGCAAVHKNPSFASEREYRILTLPSWKGKRHDNLGEFKMVTTPSQIKKCLYFNWKKGCIEHNILFENLIKKIVIGPKSHQDLDSMKEWISFMGLGQLANHIVKSESSLY